MATKSERLQKAWHQFDEEHAHAPNGTYAAARWAVENGILDLPRIDPYDILAGEMAAALREEYQTDAKGRRYRVNHAARITKGGQQYTFWATMGFAPHTHMVRAFGQRRDQIIGDCLQLRTDVDVYNDLIEGQHPPVQLVLDFTDDVAERIEAESIKPRRRKAA